MSGMHRMNACVRCVCVLRQPADGRCRAPNAARLCVVLLLAISAYVCFGVTLFAQTPASPTGAEANHSWTAINDSKSNNLMPTRITERHSQNGNQTLDERS